VLASVRVFPDKIVVFSLKHICNLIANPECSLYSEIMTKIAIIEDDQAISQMYRFKFEADGFEVETAENGKLGLELVEKMRPQIILLDLMMPEMTGDEMLAAMRIRLEGMALLLRKKEPSLFT
jgi:DNA-binding NtrC family response regulator